MAQRTENNAPFGFRTFGKVIDDITELFGLTGGGGASYTVYRCTLKQTGTNAPVATVIENTLSGTPVWSRTFNGDYTLTLAGEFPDENKVVILTPTSAGTLSGLSRDIYAASNYADVNAVYLQTAWIDTSGSYTPSDDVMWQPSYFEVRVYA